MEFFQAFPIAIIDEDYEGKLAAGRGMRQLAEAIEKQGFRVVGGITYADALRLANVINTTSCWLISVDGTEQNDKQWEILEAMLAAKRSRGNGAGECDETRQCLHAFIRGLARVSRACYRSRGRALSRSARAADV
jgi:hypothetical protein